MIGASRLKIVGLGILILGVVMQFLPLGYPRSNPPILTDLAWSSKETRNTHTEPIATVEDAPSRSYCGCRSRAGIALR